jgi:hypothetical protein
MQQPLTLMKINDVSKRLAVCVATLRTWDREGKLSSVRTPGNHRRYRPADIEAFEQVMNARGNAPNERGPATYPPPHGPSGLSGPRAGRGRTPRAGRSRRPAPTG